MVKVTKSYIRVPVKRVRCARGSYRMKTLSKRKGIKGLLCCQHKLHRGRCSTAMKLVTVLYSKAQWTKKKAVKNARGFRR